MKRQFLIGVFFLMAAVRLSYGQDDKSNNYDALMLPAPRVIATDCKDAKNPLKCTNKKIFDAIISSMNAEKIRQIISEAKYDTIDVRTKLRFTSKKRLFLHKSSIRFQEKDLYLMKSRITSDVERIQFIPWNFYTPLTGKKYIRANTFRVGLDSIHNKIFFIFEKKNMIRKEIKADRFALLPSCEKFSVYEDQKKCFRKFLEDFIVKNFDIESAKKAGISGIKTCFLELNFIKNGTVEFSSIRPRNAFIRKEIERIINLLPKVKPATLQGEPISIPYQGYKIKFKI